jgi:hypothetical protein
MRGTVSLIITTLLLCAIGVTPAQAQLNTQHISGTVGLKAGSQAPPHFYAILPLLYVYNTDRVNTSEGDRLPIDADLTMSMYGAGFLKVTTKKVFGANYGFSVLFPVGANARIQGTEIDANPGAGISDSVVQPLNLGWHFSRADAVANYLVYVPTGRYTDGASDNTGLGMWGHEISFGTTVYLNEARQFHAATLASFNFQTKKEDSETQVGNAMNLEGGIGGDFLKGGLTAGLAYYASFKLTDDTIEGIPGILIQGKDRVFALGPEATLAIARKGVLYGFLRVNYQWEVYARTSTQGGAFNLLLTLPLKPITIPTP